MSFLASELCGLSCSLDVDTCVNVEALLFEEAIMALGATGTFGFSALSSEMQLFQI